MSDLSGTVLEGWHVGIHPHAAGLRVRSLERVEIPLGEALRLEMADGGPGTGDTVHLQHHVMTPAGLWALWISCGGDDVAGLEAALDEVVPPFTREPLDQPPILHGHRAPLAACDET